MSTVAGRLVIDLLAGTVGFDDPLDKSSAKLRDFGAEADRQKSRLRGLGSSAGQTGQSFAQMGTHGVTGVQATSGALRVLEGNMNNNLRAAERFMATTLGLGPALQKIFPLVGGLAMLGILDHLIGKIGEAREAFQKLADAPKRITESFRGLSESIARSNDELRVSNDKLENEIAKLSGKPENGLKLALHEAWLEADKLAESLRKDFEELNKLLKENKVSLFDRLVGGKAGTGDLTDQLKKAGRDITNAQYEGLQSVKAVPPGKNADVVAAMINDNTEARVASIRQAAIDKLKGQLSEAQKIQQEFLAPPTTSPALAGALLGAGLPVPRGAVHENQDERIATLQQAIEILEEQNQREPLRDQNANLTATKDRLTKQNADADSLTRPYQDKLHELDAQLAGVKEKLAAVGQSVTAETLAKSWSEAQLSIAKLNDELAKHKQSLTLEQQVELVTRFDEIETSKAEEEWRSKLVQTTTSINDKIRSLKLLTAAIGEGYEAQRKATVETQLFEKLGEKANDPAWMKAHTADVQQLRVKIGTEYDTQHTNQIATAVDKLHDQIELEKSLASVELGGANAARTITLAYQLKEIAQNSGLAVTQEAIQKEIDLATAEQRAINLPKLQQTIATTAEPAATTPEQQQVQQAGRQQIASTVEASDTQLHTQARTRLSDIQQEIDATNRLTVARLGGAAAERQAQLENRIAQINRAPGSDEDKKAEIAKVIELSQVEHQQQILAEALKTGNSYKDQLQSLTEQISVLQSVKALGGDNLEVEISLKKLEEERVQTLREMVLVFGNARDGMRAFFQELATQAKSSAQQAYDALDHAFNSLNDTLAKLVSGQKVSWASFFKGISEQIAKMELKQLEAVLSKRIFGGVTATAPGRTPPFVGSKGTPQGGPAQHPGGLKGALAQIFGLGADVRQARDGQSAATSLFVTTVDASTAGNPAPSTASVPAPSASVGKNPSAGPLPAEGQTVPGTDDNAGFQLTRLPGGLIQREPLASTSSTESTANADANASVTVSPGASEAPSKESTFTNPWTLPVLSPPPESATEPAPARLSDLDSLTVSPSGFPVLGEIASSITDPGAYAGLFAGSSRAGGEAPGTANGTVSDVGVRMQQDALSKIPHELRGYTAEELAQPSGRFNSRTGQKYTMGQELTSIPVLDAPIAGVQDIAHGVEQMAEPSGADQLRGAGKIVRGSLDVAAPAMAGLGAAAPLSAAAWYAATRGIGSGARHLAEFGGMNPEDAQLTGDVAAALPLAYGLGMGTDFAGADTSLGNTARFSWADLADETGSIGRGSGRKTRPDFIDREGWFTPNGDFFPTSVPHEHLEAATAYKLGSSTSDAIAKGNVRVSGTSPEYMGLQGTYEHADKVRGALDSLVFPDDSPLTVELGDKASDYYAGTVGGAKQWVNRQARLAGRSRLGSALDALKDETGSIGPGSGYAGFGPKPASLFEQSGGKIFTFPPHAGADIPGDFMSVAAHPNGPGVDEGIREMHDFRPEGSSRWPADLNPRLAEQGMTPESIVGYSLVRPDAESPTRMSAVATHVAEDYRRQGAATGMYDAAEEAQGERLGVPTRMEPSPLLTPDAVAFWNARLASDSTASLPSVLPASISSAFSGLLPQPPLAPNGSSDVAESARSGMNPDLAALFPLPTLPPFETNAYRDESSSAPASQNGRTPFAGLDQDGQSSSSALYVALADQNNGYVQPAAASLPPPIVNVAVHAPAPTTTGTPLGTATTIATDAQSLSRAAGGISPVFGQISGALGVGTSILKAVQDARAASANAADAAVKSVDLSSFSDLQTGIDELPNMDLSGLADLPDFGGGFAAGGRPPTGKVSVVGEKGPELFVPDQAGTIIPNHKLSDVATGARATSPLQKLLGGNPLLSGGAFSGFLGGNSALSGGALSGLLGGGTLGKVLGTNPAVSGGLLSGLFGGSSALNSGALSGVFGGTAGQILGTKSTFSGGAFSGLLGGSSSLSGGALSGVFGGSSGKVLGTNSALGSGAISGFIGGSTTASAGALTGLAGGSSALSGGALGGFIGGGGSASGGGVLGSLFGGHRASGGDVKAGKVHVVGEKGPELFVPKGDGTIIPNDRLASLALPSSSESSTNTKTSTDRFAALFGGYRATGGDVDPSAAYLVGEQGPEILMGASGTIASNSASHRMLEGGATQNAYYSIDARGTDPIQTEQRVRQALIAVHGSAVQQSIQVQREQTLRTPQR